MVAGEAGQPPAYGWREQPDPWNGDRYPPRPAGYQPPADPYRDYPDRGYQPDRSFDPARRYGEPPPPAARPVSPPAARPVSPPPRRPAQPATPYPEDLDDELRPPVAPALSWTIAAYLVPMLLYLAWAFTRSGEAPPNCVDATGAPCPPPRVEAAENLLSILPAVVGALALALLIAIGLRRLAVGWRAVSVGLAAAVIGGGFVTVVTATIS
ncbi:MAG TPA: hypothetical protein VIL37_11125 [Natronosporangium sp.]